MKRCAWQKEDSPDNLTGFGCGLVSGSGNGAWGRVFQVVYNGGSCNAGLRKRRGSGDSPGLQNRRLASSMSMVRSTRTRFRQFLISGGRIVGIYAARFYGWRWRGDGKHRRGERLALDPVGHGED